MNLSIVDPDQPHSRFRKEIINVFRAALCALLLRPSTEEGALP
jgi:hypothetical protein